MWQFVLVFILGALTVVGVEAAAAVFLIRWLSRRLSREVDKAKVSAELSSPPDLDPSYYNKQADFQEDELSAIPYETEYSSRSKSAPALMRNWAD
nr:testis-expressed sequence 2 protein-like isoform X1 [Ipomoea batatas]